MSIDNFFSSGNVTVFSSGADSVAKSEHSGKVARPKFIDKWVKAGVMVMIAGAVALGTTSCESYMAHQAEQQRIENLIQTVPQTKKDSIDYVFNKKLMTSMTNHSDPAQIIRGIRNDMVGKADSLTAEQYYLKKHADNMVSQYNSLKSTKQGQGAVIGGLVLGNEDNGGFSTDGAVIGAIVNSAGVNKEFMKRVQQEVKAYEQQQQVIQKQAGTQRN